MTSPMTATGGQAADTMATGAGALAGIRVIDLVEGEDSGEAGGDKGCGEVADALVVPRFQILRVTEPGRVDELGRQCRLGSIA